MPAKGKKRSRATREAVEVDALFADLFRVSTAKLRAAFRSAKPFPHLYVEGAFDDAVMKAARDELLAGEWFRKRVDLYDFLQSEHLRRLEEVDGTTALRRVRDGLYSQRFRSWIEAVTGIQTLAEPVDLSAAQYLKGGHLLCHDDNLSGRVIAFIIYLVPPDWAAEDGGGLDLFTVNSSTGHPEAVCKTLLPRWNSMAFFEVTPASFHAVAEVLSSAKGPRLSISGWLHGAPPPRPEPMALPAPSFLLPPEPQRASASSSSSSSSSSSEGIVVHLDTEALGRWIQPQWIAALLAGDGAALADHFSEHGTLELCPFLLPAAFNAALRAMRVQQWRAVGPAHLRRYSVAAACHCEASWGTDGAVVDGSLVTQASQASSPQLLAPLPLATRRPKAALRTWQEASKAQGGSGEAASQTAGPGEDAALALWRFMRSEALATFLSLATGCGAVRRWATEARALGPGCYTLVTDPQLRGGAVKPAQEDEEGGAGKRSKAFADDSGDDDEADALMVDADDDDDDDMAVEACLCMLDPFHDPPVASSSSSSSAATDVWPEEFGGYTVALTADEELCTVEAKSNALSLVGLPPGATTFVKYVTADCPGVRYDVMVRAKLTG